MARGGLDTLRSQRLCLFQRGNRYIKVIGSQFVGDRQHASSNPSEVRATSVWDEVTIVCVLLRKVGPTELNALHGKGVEKENADFWLICA